MGWLQYHRNQMQPSPVFQHSPGVSDGIKQELAELYSKHSAALLRYGSLFAPANEAARDAVQEAFLRYFIERRSGRIIANPAGWLYEVMRHYLLGRLKRMRAREVGDAGLELLPSPNGNPEAQFVEAEVTRRMAACLTVREMECVTLRAGGLSYREIADVMAVRPGTVGAVLSRVQKKMRSRE
jgi:RNA polymerase sigma-70 factor, ECF subfamily